jgi:hypothetical protein
MRSIITSQLITGEILRSAFPRYSDQKNKNEKIFLDSLVKSELAEKISSENKCNVWANIHLSSEINNMVNLIEHTNLGNSLNNVELIKEFNEDDDMIYHTNFTYNCMTNTFLTSYIIPPKTEVTEFNFVLNDNDFYSYNSSHPIRMHDNKFTVINLRLVTPPYIDIVSTYQLNTEETLYYINHQYVKSATSELSYKFLDIMREV